MGNSGLSCCNKSSVTIYNLEVNSEEKCESPLPKVKSNLSQTQYDNLITVQFDNEILPTGGDQCLSTNSKFVFTDCEKSKTRPVSYDIDAEVSSSCNKNQIEEAPWIMLEVLNSRCLTKGQVLKIGPKGLQDSLREKQDGFTYFGSNNDAEVINDFLISNSEEEIQANGQHFQIKFDQTTFSYLIKDLGSGFGCFYKVKKSYALANHSLINIGNSYVVITINKEEEYTIITAKAFTGSIQYEAVSFHPLQKLSLVIGRNNDCDIVIEDQMLSKYHCTIDYTEDNIWEIRDGYKVKNDSGEEVWDKSTNGSWIFLAEEANIFDGMLIKYNFNLFKVKL